MPKHVHTYAYLDVALQGASSDIDERKTRVSQQHWLRFHPAGEAHATCIHACGARLFSIHLTHTWLERVQPYLGRLDSPRDLNGGLPAWLAVRLYDEFRTMDAASPLAIEGLVLEFLAEVSRCSDGVAERRPTRWLCEARDLLHAHFTESLSVDELAASVGIHPHHLTRAFREQYGCTLGEYLRKLRIEHAQRQLTTSDAPLAKIAVEAGFADQSHFSKTFKRETGMTPTEFRRTFPLR
jgi:AraC family transcriptional regulator